ncbi:MAG: hypothetical protein ACTSYB_09695 [Candidatus Helarchaeota archaeon]
MSEKRMTMHLSIIGWLNGLISLLIVCCASVFGILMAFESKEKESKMLLFGGLMGFFAGMLWLGPVADFISVIITGQNLPNELVYGVLTFIWIFPLIVCSMYVGGELMLSEKKKYLVVIFSFLLGLIFDIILLSDLDGAIQACPNPGGTELYDASIVIGHPTFYLIIIMLVMLFSLVVLGGIHQSLKTTGGLRRRFIYISLAIFLFIPIAIVDAFYSEPAELVLAMRLLMLLAAWCLYLSLKIEVKF